MQLVLTGFHAIEEAVKHAKDKTPAKDFCLYYGDTPGIRTKKILEQASQKKLAAQKVSTSELDALVKHLPELLQNHRGLVLVYKENQALVNIETFLASVEDKPTVTVAILSQIIDPHNVGAIVRSADQFGLDAIIVSEHKSAGDYATIAKISSGASKFVPIIVVKNINRVAETLKEKNFWLYGADLTGEALPLVEFAERSCIILGSEATGIAKSLKDKVDIFVTIPTCGHVDSLNVSNAAAIVFYERFRKRPK